MSFLKLIIGSIIFAFVVWSSLLFYGKLQRFTPYDHPVMKIKTPWIMAYGGESLQFPSHTKIAFDKSVQNQDVWLAVDVFLSSENHFFAIPETYKNPLHRDWNLMSDSEIENLDAGLQIQNSDGSYPFKGQGLHFFKIEDLVNKYPQTHFLFWFRNNVKDLDLIISSMLKKIPGLDNRILIHSDFDVVLSSLKEILPRWVYGCGVGGRTRFLMLESIQLESTVALKGDFYLTQLKQGVVSLVNPSLRDELQRRYIPLIIGPIDGEKEYAQAFRLAPQGFLTKDTTAFIKFAELNNK